MPPFDPNSLNETEISFLKKAKAAGASADQAFQFLQKKRGVEQAPEAPAQTLLGKPAVGAVAKFMGKTQPIISEKGIRENIAEAPGGFTARAVERGGRIQEFARQEEAGEIGKTRQVVKSLGEGGSQVTDTFITGFGKVLGLGVDIATVGRGKELAKDFMEKESVKKSLSFVAEQAGKGVDITADFISKLPGMKQIVDKYDALSPEDKKLVLEDLHAVGGITEGLSVVLPVVEIAPAAAMLAGRVGAGAAKTGGEVVEAFITRKPRAAIKNLPSNINEAINRGVKPSVGQVKAAGGQEKYLEKARQAVGEITNNKKNLKLFDKAGDEITGELPKTVQQFEDSIKQTKKSIFGEYNALSKEAGETGVLLDTKKTANELSSFLDDPITKDLKPEIAKYAEVRAEALFKRGSYTPEQAEQAIASLNNSLKAFYRNPTFDSASKAAVDSMIANNFRQNLDEIITGSTGAQYQELKNAYGSLKTIEKDVAQRAIVEGRKAAKGLIDFTDIFSAGDLAAGLATMEPVFFAKAATQKAVKEWFKWKNTPDNIIKKMFGQADEAINVAPQKIRATSKTADTPNSLVVPRSRQQVAMSSKKSIPQETDEIPMPWDLKQSVLAEVAADAGGSQFTDLVKKIAADLKKSGSSKLDGLDYPSTVKFLEKTGRAPKLLERLKNLEREVQQIGTATGQDISVDEVFSEAMELFRVRK